MADHYHIKHVSGLVTIDDDSRFFSFETLLEVSSINACLSPLTLTSSATLVFQHYSENADGLSRRLVEYLACNDNKLQRVRVAVCPSSPPWFYNPFPGGLSFNGRF